MNVFWRSCHECVLAVGATYREVVVEVCEGVQVVAVQKVDLSCNFGNVQIYHSAELWCVSKL